MGNTKPLIKNIVSVSGKNYRINTLETGKYQYMDRQYQFNYIPRDLRGCSHIKTHGNDKLISENNILVSFEVTAPVDVYILYAEKFPVLPQWLAQYESTRYKITRYDSNPHNLKGYFGIYKKSFSKGVVKLYGCSPTKMLKEEWYKESNGATYCMYSIVLKRIRREK